MRSWDSYWVSEEYVKNKQKEYDELVSFLKPNIPKKILDIGCGFAHESRLFYKNYNTDIWLIDGDYKNNGKEQFRDVGFGSVKSMKFYNTIERIEKVLKEDGVNNYHIMTSNNINIPKDVKFDFIYSSRSCGWHYKIDSYIELIKQHSHANTKVILDLRNNIKHNCKILNKLKVDHAGKGFRCEVEVY